MVVCSERNTDYVRPKVHEVCYRLTRGRSDGVIANSHAGKAFVVRTLGLRDEDVFVVPNGVDGERFCPGDGSGFRREMGIGADDPVVGMVASFKRQKNHGMFFEVAERVWGRFERAWFVCVGEPLRDNVQGAEDYHREVREKLATMAVRERVLMPGSRDDIEAVYRACDVTVLTSRHEGTPNVLLESMASEVPVVATDVSDNAKVVTDGETGFVVGLDDAEAMAYRVCALLGDEALRGRMGRCGRERVLREYSPEEMARRTGEVYEELLRRRGEAL